MYKSKLLTNLFSIALAIFIITFSIALPIFFRPFYYMHIDALSLPEKTGVSSDQIKNAYDEVLDYLTIPGKDFGTGVFAYSQVGYDHFKDCRVLFYLSNALLFISLSAVITFLILDKKGKIRLERKKNMHIAYTVAKRLLIFFVIIVALASTSFNTAFTIFHKLFFPGKDNWLFNRETDPFIVALPATFFRNCAILIASSIILWCLGMIIFNLIKRKSPR